ncbi:OB-fold domain-containing protein [uncultured Sphingomonas sp.]|uniref:Zn-ribbon domain-containing OB-fold protein n=1 Tax=uncultured Sphingomonas sp. TaxID=158754 RepID=UPI0026058D99|nr:OB-fold domain-containing protein [uncultured Sphingomonas sp.]
MTARAAHKSIRVGDDGEAWIEAYRCDACGAVVGEPTLACRNCAIRAAPSAFRVAERGMLYSWTVVSRSYPGVVVPFVSAIVDLDDGPTMKGTLRDVDPDTLASGMPVAVRFDDAGGAVDKEGAAFVGFHFVPAGETL